MRSTLVKLVGGPDLAGEPPVCNLGLKGMNLGVKDAGSESILCHLSVQRLWASHNLISFPL